MSPTGILKLSLPKTELTSLLPNWSPGSVLVNGPITPTIATTVCHAVPGVSGYPGCTRHWIVLSWVNDSIDPWGRFEETSRELMAGPGTLCELSLGCFWERCIIHPFILHSTCIPVPSTGVCMHTQQRTAALFIIIRWRGAWSGRTSRHLSWLQAPQICICPSAGSLAPLICLVGGQRARPRQVTAFGSRARPVGTSFPKSVLSHQDHKNTHVPGTWPVF